MSESFAPLEALSTGLPAPLQLALRVRPWAARIVEGLVPSAAAKSILWTASPPTAPELMAVPAVPALWAKMVRFDFGTIDSFDSAICLPVSVLFLSRAPEIECFLMDAPLIARATLAGTPAATALPPRATMSATNARTKAGDGLNFLCIRRA